MKLLVLGAQGQVGADVMKVALAHPEFEAEDLDRSHLDLGQTEDIPGKLGDHRFDVLLNCAAYTNVDAAEFDPQSALGVNGRAVEALAKVCRDQGIRFGHLGTDYGSDGLSRSPYSSSGDPPAPLNAYGASRLLGEALARSVYPRGTVIVPASAVFRLAGMRPRGGGNFVQTMLGLAQERSTLRAVAENEMVPTFSADLAAGLLKLVATSPASGIYHLTNEGRTSWHGLAVAAMELARSRVQVEPIPASGYQTPARRPPPGVQRAEYQPGHRVLRSDAAPARCPGEVPQASIRVGAGRTPMIRNRSEP